MAKYECDRCHYITNNKRDFDIHTNRKIPCNPNKPNKKIKVNKNFFCKTCDKSFSRQDSLARHNKTYHAKIDGDNNKVIVGDHNTQNNIDTQNNVQTQINNPIIIQNIVINSYDQNDLNDLTLFEQYLALTSKKSPYTALLNHLNLNPNKPKYHNMKYSNINKNTMDVFDGKDWLKEIVNNAVLNIVDSKKIMIQIIFNRFRLFLSDKATYIIPKSYYYGCVENLYFHKKLVHNVKLHLYNNRKNNKNKETYFEAPVPNDRKDPVFWALSKKFSWNEVDEIITLMDENNIDFNNNLNDLKILITNNSTIFSDLLYNKLIKRLNYFINEFIKDNEKNKKSKLTSTPDSSDCSDTKSDSDN